MKKILLIMFVSLLLIGTATAASDLIYAKDTALDLKVVCINDGFCSATANCNLSIFDPDGGTVLSSQVATQSADLAFFNVTLTPAQTAKVGEYQVTGFCKDSAVVSAIDFPFIITHTGDEIKTGSYIFYPLAFIILMGGMLFLFVDILGKFTKADIGLRDIVIALIAYTSYLFFYVFAKENFGNVFIMDLMEIFLYVFGFMFLFIPLVGIIFSWIKHKEVSG